MKRNLHLLTLLALLISLGLTTLVRVDMASFARSAGSDPAAGERLAVSAPAEDAGEEPIPVSSPLASPEPKPTPAASPLPRLEASPISVPAPSPSAKPSPSFSPAPTPSSSPSPTPTPEPTPEYFTISAIGDCTLTSHQNLAASNPASYASVMGENYAYPFENTIQYFDHDELTIANLECTLSDTPLYSGSLFHFRAPTAYAQILSEGGVDFVTTANNHTADFGRQGIDETCAALDAQGIPYGLEGQAQILTTPNGLKIGIYCDYNGYYPKTEKCVEAIRQLKEDGADYVICMFHWGQDELVYHPKQVQIELAHACVDAGADFIYGSHSHCLQPYEEYNGAYILYSIGNWSFGGNTSPSDMDTAIFQVCIRRDPDGSVSNESCGIIPCCVSSRPVLEYYTGYGYNDYCPTPYEPGTELYDRAMSKIMGTYGGPDGNVDYSGWRNSYG
ncbi:MAG: CapA family protein [Oscillospiraceae bacterium]|nr:CapA family protein [Oscillospiraceae bacterium]